MSTVVIADWTFPDQGVEQGIFNAHGIRCGARPCKTEADLSALCAGIVLPENVVASLRKAAKWREFRPCGCDELEARDRKRSRGAAPEGSPRREPWVARAMAASPGGATEWARREVAFGAPDSGTAWFGLPFSTPRAGGRCSANAGETVASAAPPGLGRVFDLPTAGAVGYRLARLRR